MFSEEAMEFCQNYLAKVRHNGLPKRHHADGGRRGASVKTVDPDELSQVHLYILNNVDEVQASIAAHKEAVRKENHRMTEQRLIRSIAELLQTGSNKRSGERNVFLIQSNG